MSLALSIYLLFVLLIQLVNGAEFLNTTCVLLFCPPPANAANAIVPLTSVYASP